MPIQRNFELFVFYLSWKVFIIIICFSSPRLVYFMPQMCLIALQTCKSTLFTFHIASQEGPVKFFIQSYANKFSHALIKYRFDIN